MAFRGGGGGGGPSGGPSGGPFGGARANGGDGRGDEEATPLLQQQQRDGGGEGALGGGGAEAGGENGDDNVVLVAPLDEYALPYNSVAGGPPMVACRVCQNMIDITGKRDQHVVKCNSCNEATPIRNAPVGRKYVRCPCYCLLICKNTSQRIACPRPNCKRVISLAPSGPPAHAPVPSVPGMCRVNCAHCQDNFLFNTLNNALARCPHCRKISSVGGDFSKKRGLIFTTVGLLLLAVAVGVLFGTLSLAATKAGLYVLYVGLFLVATVVILRGVYYCTMKVSLVDGPV